MKQAFIFSGTLLCLFLPLSMAQKKTVVPPPPAAVPTLKDAEEILAKAAVTNKESVASMAEAQAAHPELPATIATARKEAATAVKVASAVSAIPRPVPIEPQISGAPDYVQASAAKSDKKKKSNMRITAAASFFDSGKSEGVFMGGVVVDDPTMHIESEQLNVKLEDKDNKTPPPAAPKLSAETPPGAEEESQDEAKIEYAIATGQKVYIRKPPTPKGKVQYGYCQKATYFGGNKDILMEKWAVVYDGPNIVRATSIETTILLKENGEFKVSGPNQVDIAKETTKGMTTPGASPDKSNR